MSACHNAKFKTHPARAPGSELNRVNQNKEDDRNKNAYTQNLTRDSRRFQGDLLRDIRRGRATAPR